jgi:aminoglycoside 3-N-acetyltransferase
MVEHTCERLSSDNMDVPEMIVTRSQITQDLESLGLQAGQVVMLHASVKAIGYIVGGPDVVLQALLEVLSPAGTLMMYAGWESSPYDAQYWPEDIWRKARLEWPAYDPASSRAMRKWSILTEYLRTWPGACRSRHPDGSSVALGARAEWLCADHPLQYGYGPGSPLAKLCEIGGQVLLLGAPLEALTILHHAEHLARVPNKRVVHYQMPVLEAGQRIWIDLEEFDTAAGIVDWGGPEEYFFGEIGREFLESGQGRSGRVGAGQSYLFDARALVEFGVRWMEDRFGGK